MNKKLGQPHFQKTIFFKKIIKKWTWSILLVQIEFTLWTKVFEPWSMGLPIVSSKKWGTMRFYGPRPKPSSANSH
jgi:hypothetical protein